MIRVGTITYDRRGNKTYPTYPGFTLIEVMTASSKYGEIGPYVLKDDEGRIMENIWQSMKVYPYVPTTRSTFSRWDNTVIWSHPHEIHIDEHGELTPEYWAWRDKLSRNPYPVRYPVGRQHRHKCVYAEWEGEKLDYVQSRKRIYFPLYTTLVEKEEIYAELKERLDGGENLLIAEVDGPKEESMPYYKENYGVDDEFIENRTILVNDENMDLMLNDTRHAFGHGYCLAMSLLQMSID